MDLVASIIQGEVEFPSRFSNVERRPYGVLYHNVEIPDSHDSNHAWILRMQDLKAEIADIVSFYRARQLTPRVNQLCRRARARMCATPSLPRGLWFSGSAMTSMSTVGRLGSCGMTG